MRTRYSFSQQVNRFIKSLKKHNDAIEVVTISPMETIIFYEDYPCEPIINYHSTYDTYYRTAGQRRWMTDEEKEKSMEATTKGKHKFPQTEEHKAKIKATKEAKKLEKGIIEKHLSEAHRLAISKGIKGKSTGSVVGNMQKSIKMRNNNPMKDPEIVTKALATKKRNRKMKEKAFALRIEKENNERRMNEKNA
jgi:hypothetical protein